MLSDPSPTPGVDMGVAIVVTVVDAIEKLRLGVDVE